MVEQFISITELNELAKQRFGDMVKGVADLEKGIMALGGELHADEEAVLLERGSKQDNLWGFNIYVDQPRESWLEYNSMINIPQVKIMRQEISKAKKYKIKLLK